jgi:hypothetical protein
VSSTIVTDPSFTSETSIRAPKTPRATLSRLFDPVLELAVVLGLVVVALRLGDEAVVAERPLLEA